MGLFTNRCVNPDCRHRVRKGSQFCPKCGTAAPKGLRQCGSCGSEVSATSKFCWKCGADLSQTVKTPVLGDRWARGSGDFAVRVDNQDIKGRLSKPLIVEHGTRAMLFQDGKYKGELDEGRYDMGGFLKRLGNLMIDKATNVVLVEAGDVTLDLENGELWTSDHIEVGTVERLVLRISDPDSMFLNVFKGRSRVGLDDLELELAGEVQMLLSGIVAGFEANELFTNIEIRNKIESQLRDTVSVTLGRLGLELVQLRFISFAGRVYEELRRKRGELREEEGRADIGTERLQLVQRMRETLTLERMDQIRTDNDLKDFKCQTEHELGLKDVVRDDEIKRLGQRLGIQREGEREKYELERQREGLLRRIEIEGIRNDERREQAWKELLADERNQDETHRRQLERGLSEAKTEAEKKRIELQLERLEHDEDMRQAEDGLRLHAKMKDIEYEEATRAQELEVKTLEARSKATAEALMSIADGPAADRIMKLEKLRSQQNMTPEQILALAAQASPVAAEALARKYETEGMITAERVNLLEKQLAEQRKMADEYADRMERLMQVAMTQMGDVAGTRARPVDPKQTIVAGAGGIGRPVVINPQDAGGGVCKHCQAPLETGAEFCSQCGKKQ